MTQVELADANRKSAATVGEWEHGGREVRLGDVRACARVLRCRLADLLAAPDAPTPLRTQRRRLRLPIALRPLREHP